MVTMMVGMKTTTNPKAAPKTDKYGFAIRVCTRCKGSGSFSRNAFHGTMCYGCSGTGWQHTPKAARQYDAWCDAGRKLQHPENAGELAVGDKVLASRHSKTWREVVRVTKVGAYSWDVELDGGEVLVGTCAAFRRKGWIDPALFQV